MTFTITKELFYLVVVLILLFIQVWQTRKLESLKKEIQDLWNQISIIAISAGNSLQKIEKKLDEKQDKE